MFYKYSYPQPAFNDGKTFYKSFYKSFLPPCFQNFLKLLSPFFSMVEKKRITNFALSPDEETLKQFKHCYSQDYVLKASLMPDAHVGYVAPIGAVLISKGFLVPAWVGYDIGCGMTAARLPKKYLEAIKNNKKEIYEEVKKNVPMGLGMIHKSEKTITEKTKREFKKILKEFKSKPHNKQVLQFLESGKALRNIGTLGHGNHFISINEGEKGFPWIVVHSGSRAVGYWTAKFYMKKASGKKEVFEATHALPENSKEGKEYQNLLDFGLEFAKLNRLEMIYQSVSSVESVLGMKKGKLRFKTWTNKNHNHALKEKGLFVHRKGATPAKRGERGIIPGNMRDGSFLVRGKGSRKFLSSSSHGAGRKLSVSHAKKSLDVEKFKSEMEKEDIFGKFDKNTVVESPDAYKDIYKVLQAQKESIRVLNHLKPLINWQREKRNPN